MAGRKRNISKEDQTLWKITSDTVDPLKDRGRVMESGEDARQLSAYFEEFAPEVVPSGKPVSETAKRSHKSPSMPSYSPPQSAGSHSDGVFEARRARKLARGQLAIDGRIDLHGLRQDEARRALRSFILSAYARDARNVLVITGKGRSGGDNAWFESNTRGVLRQEVPRWLMSSDLGQVVVGCTAAHQRHGGDGALYVQLRARRK